jgi:hypothetical protein
MTPPDTQAIDIEAQIEAKRAECDRLRTEMHEAPMNKVFQDHTGHRFLGTHSMAWARKSRDWAEAIKDLARLEKIKDGTP